MTTGLPPGLGPLAAVGARATPDLRPSGWGTNIDQVMAHGLAGLLIEAWRTGGVDLTDEDLDRLEVRLQAEARLAVRLEAELLRLAELLARVRGVVLKGPALAHGAYPDPSWRPFTDLDILVPARTIPATIERLIALGYRRPRPDPSPGFLVRIAKATALEHPSGLVVDLHRTLATGNVGEAVIVDDLLRHQIVIAAGDVSVPAPPWPAHLIEVGLHALVGDGLARAISLRDVVQVAAHPEVDPARFIELAERWHVSGPLALALDAAHRALGVALPVELDHWVTDRTSSPTLLGAGPAAQRSARLRLDELRHGTLRRRATLVRSLVAPTPTFLRWQYGNGSIPSLYGQRWRHLVARRRQARTEA